MKKKQQEGLSFYKTTIAILNNNQLTKILGGSDREPPVSSIFYSDGPPSTDISG